MSAAKNPKNALNVIDRAIRIKDKIDEPIDIEKLKNKEFAIDDGGSEQPSKKLQIVHRTNRKDVGFNSISELNLGYAYKKEYNYKHIEGGEVDDVPEIVSDGPAMAYAADEPLAMNKKWLDFMLSQIEAASNSAIVVGDIFTRRTTGNYKQVLSYEDQLQYAYHIFNKPTIKSRIVALIRGKREEDILRYSEIDLMQKLGEMLGIPDKVVDGGVNIDIFTNSHMGGKNCRPISFAHVNCKTNSRTTIAKTFSDYANSRPGHDVYFMTASKENWRGVGMTTTRGEDGKMVSRPCWYIAHGPMYRFDNVNIKSPKLAPYTLNQNWHRVFVCGDGSVKATYCDYRFPHTVSRDYSSYTASMLANECKKLFKEAEEMFSKSILSEAERNVDLVRRGALAAMGRAKEIKKQREQKLIEQEQKEREENLQKVVVKKKLNSKINAL